MIWVEIRNGNVFFEGDILLGKADDILRPDNLRSATISPSLSGNLLWPDNTVPFVIQDNHPESSAITQALTYVFTRTNLNFVRRTNETNYVKFVANQEGCFSSIGMVGGEQIINMDGNCGVGAGIHEIGHAIGLFHEQSRQDRDKYVTIKWDNIIENKKSNFQTYNALGRRGVDFDDYDYNSIMHYGPNAFSLNGQPTIEIKSPPAKPGTTLGNDRFSPIDILSINNLYRLLPQSKAPIELSSELGPSPNPFCNKDPFTILTSIKNKSVDTIEGGIQLYLHDKNSGDALIDIGPVTPFSLSDPDEEFEINISQNSLDIPKGEYLLALWLTDEEGNRIEPVYDGEYSNGKLIKVIDQCGSSGTDVYEFNDNEKSAFHLPFSTTDSLVTLATMGASIHTIGDVDYYNIQLPEDINYFVNISLSDIDNPDGETDFTNDIIASMKVPGNGWHAYKNLSFEEVQVLNGGQLSFRAKSHFPRDTGSYKMSVKIQVDPNPMLELENKNITVNASDTTAQIVVMSNRSWSVSNEDEWINSFSRQEFGFDTIFLNFEQNTSLDDRITEFIFVSQDGTLSTTFTLIQEGIQRILKGETKNVLVCNDESQSIIFIESNTDWKASTAEDWIEVLTKDGSGNDYIIIKLDPNLLQELRKGKIMLETVDGVSQNDIDIFQPSRQEASACIDPVLFEVGPVGGQVSFDIKASSPWTIETGAEWVSNISSLEGDGEMKISIDFDDLEETEEIREARIVVNIESQGQRNVILRQGNDFTNSIIDQPLLEEWKLKLYPNPFNNVINGEVYIENESAFSIALLNIHGQPLAQYFNLKAGFGWNAFQVGTESIPPGIYFLRINSGASSVVKKLIKTQ